MDCEGVRNALANLLYKEQFVTDKSGVRTIEILGASFEADDDVIFGEVNEDWARREVAWYSTQSLNVNDIEAPVPLIWQRVADKDGFINSNYGWCIWGRDNHNQYECARHELRRNPDSRRAIMIYTRPSMQRDFDLNGRSDFMCTNTVQYMIRNGALDVVVQMRSNDLIFGYKGDRHWQRIVQKQLAGDLGVPVGKIMWQVGSAHVYERHFYMVEHWMEYAEKAGAKKVG